MIVKPIPEEAVFEGYFADVINGKRFRHPITYYFDQNHRELGYITEIRPYKFNSNTAGRRWGNEIFKKLTLNKLVTT